MPLLAGRAVLIHAQPAGLHEDKGLSSQSLARWEQQEWSSFISIFSLPSTHSPKCRQSQFMSPVTLMESSFCQYHRIRDAPGEFQRRIIIEREIKARTYNCKPLYASVLIFNSANCSGATALGESVIKSEQLATFGNAITSRSDFAFAKSITVRSSPSAMPPCGGVP